MNSRAGFTLIEMAVVLAIIAVLASILTPVVTGYIDQARVVRASADVKTIADAIRLYQRDTGRFPIYSNAANGNSDTAASHMLAGPGNAPGIAAGVAGGTMWGAYTTTTDLIPIMNSNVLGLSTGASVSLGRIVFRGPYIQAVDSDPWGNRYTVTGTNLLRSSGNWAIVVSAGANGTMDTNPNQANTGTFTAASDDVIAIIK